MRNIKGKIFLGVLGGIVFAVIAFCVAVGIGCAVNGVTFGQQITNWFGGAKAVAESTSAVLMA